MDGEQAQGSRAGACTCKSIGIVFLSVTLAATVLVDRCGTGVVVDGRPTLRRGTRLRLPQRTGTPTFAEDATELFQTNQGNATNTVNVVQDGRTPGADVTAEEQYNNRDGGTASNSGSSNSSGSNSDNSNNNNNRKTAQQKAERTQNNAQASRRSTKIRFEKKYASLRVADHGDVECRIHTSPVSVTPLPHETGRPPPSLWLDDPASGDNKTDEEFYTSSPEEGPPQYMIHVHGLMHAGTGYVRQKIYDALVNATYFTERSRRDGRPAVASVQYANWPCRHWARGEEACHAPEDEGQHLQSVYPSLKFQQIALEERRERSPGTTPADVRAYLSRAGHLSSLCAFVDDDAVEEEGDAAATAGDAEGSTAAARRKIGDVLFRQWRPFFEDPSATFLLQKTPTLEALFHERVKVLPTFHVIVVRHPWTSPSWR